MLAENASWLFRVTPYLIFAATWVAAALVPTFATGLLFSWSADLIAIIALLGSARFFLALAGMEVGTSFGGIGASREVMIASLAEPAMIMIVFTLALVAGSTQLSTVSAVLGTSGVGLRVSLGLALVALILVAIAENGRIPVDNPATHLELTMVHEAMVLEYSGRHLARDRARRVAEAPPLHVADRLRLPALERRAGRRRHRRPRRSALRAYLVKLAVGGMLLALFETSIAKMRVFRVPDFLGAGLMLGLLADAPPLRHAELLMDGLAFDVAHLLAGSLVLVSFMLLYQDRMYALLNIFALQAVVLAALGRLAGLCPGRAAPLRHGRASRSSSRRSSSRRRSTASSIGSASIARSRPSVGIGPTMLAGMALVALSMVVMLRVTAAADPLAREDLAFALSVVLLGLLMMVTRRNAVSQVVGFMSLENGLILAATGAKGMPLVVEISVAFSVLIAFIVIGIFLFRIRERFDTVDVQALDRFRGERR